MKYKICLLLLTVATFTSCNSKKNEYDPYSINVKKKEVKTESFEVQFKKTDANLKTIHVKLNNSNGYDALFDTGCSAVQISQLEAANLIKSGTLTKDDYRGQATSVIADGSQMNEPIYNIREITLVDTKGKSHTLRDVQAMIVENPTAAILVGSSVIDNIAKKSYTVDLSKKVIRFE